MYDVRLLRDKASRLYREGFNIIAAVNTVVSELPDEDREAVRHQLLSDFGKRRGKMRKYANTLPAEIAIDLPVSEEDYEALLRTIPKGVLRKKSCVRQFLGDPTWINEQIAANYHICPVD